jgi:hypothetical protein
METSPNQEGKCAFHKIVKCSLTLSLAFTIQYDVPFFKKKVIALYDKDMLYGIECTSFS